ncbi:hypothetical protein CVT26_009082, partial [Gymnopilus dilepis]
ESLDHCPHKTHAGLCSSRSFPTLASALNNKKKERSNAPFAAQEMRVQTPQHTDTPPTTPAPPKTPSRSHQGENGSPVMTAPMSQGQRRVDNAGITEQPPATPSYPRTNITFTRTVIRPTDEGPITTTVSRSISRPTIPGESLRIPGVIDIDDFDGDDDQEPPPTPTPQNRSTARRTPVATDPTSPSRPSRSSNSQATSATPSNRNATSSRQNADSSHQTATSSRAPDSSHQTATSSRAPIPNLIVLPSQLIRSNNLRPQSSEGASATIPSIREIIPRHPKSFVRPRRIGVHKWTEVLKRSWGKLHLAEGRDTYDEAHKLYTWAYDNRFIFIDPRPGSRFANQPAVERELPANLDQIPIIQEWPSPEHFRLTLLANKSKYYVIICGEQVGIWTAWMEAGARLVRVLGEADFTTVSTKNEALALYQTHYTRQTLREIPIPGGVFDRRVVVPPFPAYD